MASASPVAAPASVPPVVEAGAPVLPPAPVPPPPERAISPGGSEPTAEQIEEASRARIEEMERKIEEREAQMVTRLQVSQTPACCFLRLSLPTCVGRAYKSFTK